MCLQTQYPDETNQLKLQVNLCFFATKCDKILVAMRLTGLWHVPVDAAVTSFFIAASAIFYWPKRLNRI